MTEGTLLEFPSAATVPPREDRDWVTSAELTAEAQITYRQLDYWCRTDLMHALPGRSRYGPLPGRPETPGSGYLRRFAESEVRRALLIHDLLEAGFSLQKIREHIDTFLTEGTVTTGCLTVTTTRP